MFFLYFVRFKGKKNNKKTPNSFISCVQGDTSRACTQSKQAELRSPTCEGGMAPRAQQKTCSARSSAHGPVCRPPSSVPSGLRKQKMNPKPLLLPSAVGTALLGSRPQIAPPADALSLRGGGRCPAGREHRPRAPPPPAGTARAPLKPRCCGRPGRRVAGAGCAVPAERREG